MLFDNKNDNDITPDWMKPLKEPLTVKGMREKMDRDIHYWRRQVGLPPLQDEDKPDQ